MEKRTAARITAGINRSLTPLIVSALRNIGIENVYIMPGRSPVIEESTGFWSMFRKSDMVDDPIDVVSFFVPPNTQDAVVALLADKAQLTSPGRGSIVSEPVEFIRHHKLCSENKINKFEAPSVPLQNELMGICCIVQRGQGDTVARVALDSGAGVPAVNYGTGTGVRDKMGILRITIPGEKEIISIATSNYDAEVVMEMMIAAGKLDQPGKGFIYTYPLHSGILNLKVTRNLQRHAASIEQIVAALDHIQGGIEWRKRSALEQKKKRQFLTNLNDLTLICDEGQVDKLVKVAMQNGAAGASIFRMKYSTTQNSPTKKISPSREGASFIVSENQIETIANALQEAGAFTDDAHGLLFVRSAPRAFTYTGG